MIPAGDYKIMPTWLQLCKMNIKEIKFLQKHLKTKHKTAAKKLKLNPVNYVCKMKRIHAKTKRQQANI